MTATTAVRRTSRGHLQFDPAPALELARQQCGTGPTGDEFVALRAGISSRQLIRYRKGDWMSRDTADRVALALGYHPGEIWPEWWTA